MRRFKQARWDHARQGAPERSWELRDGAPFALSRLSEIDLVFPPHMCRAFDFGGISHSGVALAKSDLWDGCSGADLDARIVSCSQLITRGNRVAKSHQITAYINRASGYQGKGEYDRALADLDKALGLDPKSAPALTARASIYLANGELDRAIADYDTAIQIDPGNGNAFLGRANAHRGKHDLERAKQDLEAVLRVAPQLTAAKDILNEVNELIAQSATPPTATPPTAAPPTAAPPTAASSPAPAPAPAPALRASPMLLALLALVALGGLFAILLINFRSKPADKSRVSGPTNMLVPATVISPRSVDYSRATPARGQNPVSKACLKRRPTHV